ncbi:hypothetical protein AC20117_19340 [Arthrobacter crystallopoietes]|nr:hypothetical protein AC20117_19340 [Arthrobacter crystallopoietes]
MFQSPFFWKYGPNTSMHAPADTPVEMVDLFILFEYVFDSKASLQTTTDKMCGHPKIYPITEVHSCSSASRAISNI